MRKSILALLLLAAGWSVAWLVLAFAAGRQVEGFIAAEAENGRVWTCPGRRVSGYPVSLKVTCREPTFAGQSMGQRVEARSAGLTAELAITHPLHLAIALAPPLRYASSDGNTVLDGTWRDLSLDIGALPAPHAFALRGADIALGGRVAGSDAMEWRAAVVDARAFATTSRSDPTLDISVAIKAMPIPALDDLLGGTDPLDVAMTGTVTRADVGDVRTPEEALERWRRNGGSVAVSALDLTRGGAHAHGDGTLALDDLHRPEGRLDATFQGLGPILSRYGINGDVAALGSLIGTFFGGGRPAHAAPAGGLALPIVLKNGRVGIGPITTAVKLDPLY